jgi:hypothetical protein
MRTDKASRRDESGTAAVPNRRFLFMDHDLIARGFYNCPCRA